MYKFSLFYEKYYERVIIFIKNLFWMQQSIGKNNYLPKTLVHTFSHASQANQCGDPQIVGQEWAEKYYHIETGLIKSDHVMFRFDLQGYSYGIGQPLDLVWCGYNYHDQNIHQQSMKNRNIDQTQLNMNQYYRGQKLVLSFGPIKRVCNAFELYYRGHYGPTQNILAGSVRAKYKTIVTSSSGNLS